MSDQNLVVRGGVIAVVFIPEIIGGATEAGRRTTEKEIGPLVGVVGEEVDEEVDGEVDGEEDHIVMNQGDVLVVHGVLVGTGTGTTDEGQTVEIGIIDGMMTVEMDEVIGIETETEIDDRTTEGEATMFEILEETRETGTHLAVMIETLARTSQRVVKYPHLGPHLIPVELPKTTSSSSSRPNLDPDAPDHPNDDGEAMDEVNEDEDAAMMAMMGVTGFGTTK
ncbi:hypothetical protein BDZ97DRAFT_1764869, partial [Flammula alnicola]